MDFGSILQKAQQNSSDRNGSNFYKTKFDPPKKEPKSKTLSSNIQKFLQKKEEEERQKAEETKRKRDEFLAMRDPKATNKIKKMLKVTKSANRSVLDDAINTVNTAVTMDGPDQPDEDDYGYVSQEASALYSKMMEKYKNIPEVDKFSSKKTSVNHDLSSTKDRVRAAILRQKEEEMMPHKRKRKTPSEDPYNKVEQTKVAEVKQEKPKPKRPPPPPLDFNELLKIAEKKQFEPVIIESKKPETPVETERLMTKKQRKEFEEQKAYREARLRREQQRAAQSSNCQEKNKSENQTKSSNPMRIPKLSEKSAGSSTNQPSDKSPLQKIPVKKNNEATSKNFSKKESDYNKFNSNKPPQTNPNRNPSDGMSSKFNTSNKRPGDSMTYIKEQPSKHMRTDKIQTITNGKTIMNNENKLKNALTGKSDKPFNDMKQQKLLGKSSADRFQPTKLDNRLEKKICNDPKRAVPSKPPSSGLNLNKVSPGTSSQSNVLKRAGEAASMKVNKPPLATQKSRQFPPGDVQKTRSFPPNDIQKTRQFPPTDVQPRQFPPRDVQRMKAPMSKEEKLRREKMKKRMVIDDDDSEYDSSLDDFIDDGPENPEDVSTYIKEIFGYDKSRYRDVDDDDRNMESNFAQVMREEFISKKIGLMEDLEDMKMEAMEKEKKKTSVKKKHK